MQVTIELPLPSPKLSPNARTHWRVKAKVTKRARIDAKYATLDAINRTPGAGLWEDATVQAAFYFRDRRRRDKDNMLASLKAYVDGIADARLVANDFGFTHLPPKIDVDSKNPRVVLTITNAPTTPRPARRCN